jgi:hypothetical protein
MMKSIHIPAIAVVALLAGCAQFAAKDTSQADKHAAHHPAAAAGQVDPARVDQQMRTMQDMHQKMMAAKTPSERAALMQEHMKAMQGGMAMMGQMRGTSPQESGKSSMPGGMSMQHDMMQRRMDMMEMMMQMMMDREAARPPAAR